MRRCHEGAHNHCWDGAQRVVGRHRLQHHDHTRFRRSIGLLFGVCPLGGTNVILTRTSHLANTGYLVSQHGRPVPKRERQPFREQIGIAIGDVNHDA